LSIVMRAPYDVVNAMLRKAASIDADVPVQDVQTVRALEGRVLAYPRFRAALLAGFAALALVLAAVGLFGGFAPTVRPRPPQIGVRLALGAQARDVMKMVMREGLMLVCAGGVLGSGAAWALGRYLASLLYQVRGAEPVVMMAAIAVLLAAAALAIWTPARRASQVDPMVALKWE